MAIVSELAVELLARSDGKRLYLFSGLHFCGEYIERKGTEYFRKPTSQAMTTSPAVIVAAVDHILTSR